MLLKAQPLEALVKKIETIATLPQVAIGILRVANDPNAGVAEMKKVMEGDPALCTKVLRCANSSAFALKLRVTNLQQAIAYLGIKQIRNLAMTASVSQLFQNTKLIGNYSRAKLWRHLVAVGRCARLLGMRNKYRNFEDLFVAGLLHDIGIVLADQHANDDFRKMIGALDGQKTLVENEQEHLGFEHCQLGALVAEKWGLPQTVRTAIGYHHNAVETPDANRDVACYIETANIICSFKEITSVGVNLVRPCPAPFEALGFKDDDLLSVSEQLDHDLKENAAALGIG